MGIYKSPHVFGGLCIYVPLVLVLDAVSGSHDPVGSNQWSPTSVPPRTILLILQRDLETTKDKVVVCCGFLDGWRSLSIWFRSGRLTEFSEKGDAMRFTSKSKNTDRCVHASVPARASCGAWHPLHWPHGMSGARLVGCRTQELYK